MRGFWRRLWRRPTRSPQPWVLLLLGGYFLLLPLILRGDSLDSWSSALVGFGITVAASTDFLPPYRWRVGGVLRIIGIASMVLGLGLSFLVLWQVLVRS